MSALWQTRAGRRAGRALPGMHGKAGIGSEAGGADARPKRSEAPPPSLADIARHFPQLEILELLGTGGMGAVYKARQREIDRLVALKILPLEAGSDPGFAERFTREARALAKLSHPNIVALHEFGHVDGLHYFIMEFVDGLNLRQLEQAGRLSAREALQIIPQICEALQFAHDEGIVHRDIKPENVLLDKKGRVKIADFGLARILGHEPEDFRLTRAREVMGTPHYMAPEQVEKPQTVDHRADIYSLGVVFYEMLTGELPLGKFAPPSQKVQIDVRLDEVVMRALEKEPARRYQHASEVKTDMETIMTHQPALTTSTQFPLPVLSSTAHTLPPRIGHCRDRGSDSPRRPARLVWKGGNSGGAGKPGTPSLKAEASPPPAPIVPGSPAPGTNADSTQAASDTFARRYGTGPRPTPPPLAANAGSPEEAFARRYGTRAPAPSPETNAAFAVAASKAASLNTDGLVVANLTPLALKVSLDGIVTLSNAEPRYLISVQNEAAATPRERARRQYYCALNAAPTANKVFTLREVKGPAENPTAVLELNDTKELVSVDKNHPFQRVDGYAADLRYEPEHKLWTNRRVGSTLAFGGGEAEILAITRVEVVLRTKPDGKTWLDRI